MIRAVLDTNVIVSGVIKENGVPGKLLKSFLEENKFLLITSLEILREVALVLKYQKIRKIHGWSDEKIVAFLLGLHAVSLVTEGKVNVEVVKDDPDDNKFVCCALEGNADYIVTGDAHLKQLGEYKGIKIITPRSLEEKLKANL
ncbi:MAG: putative toxin-antitoxin system toxin component, PIN family [Candidatus Scalinduaceae bacterium]